MAQSRGIESGKIAIYSRKSKFTGKGESIINQQDMCRNYVKCHFPNVTDDQIVVYEDEGYSGGNTRRPQFRQMLDDFKAEKYTALICYRLDRVSRNIVDFVSLKEQLDRMGVQFISISESFDTSTSMGKAMMNIVITFSELERETIAERIRDNMMGLAKTGRWLGGHTPIGYESVPIKYEHDGDNRERKAFKLKPIPEEVTLVQNVFSLFLEKRSLTAVAKFLCIQHYKTRQGSNFTTTAVKSILRNPVYMIADKDAWDYFLDKEVQICSEKLAFDGVHGMMVYNKTEQSSHGNVYHDISEWIIAVGQHQGIVSGNEWIKANRLLDQNACKAFRKPKSMDALLSGILVCGDCGSYMRAKRERGFTADGEPMFYYLCQTKGITASTNCKMKSPNGNQLDKIVCEKLKSLSEDNSEYLGYLNGKSKLLQKDAEKLQVDLKMAEKQSHDMEQEINGLVRSLVKAEGTVAYEYVIRQIQDLDEKKKAADAQLESIEEQIRQSDMDGMSFEQTKEELLSFAKAFDSMDFERKRDAIRRIVPKIVWDGENAHLFLVGTDYN